MPQSSGTWYTTGNCVIGSRVVWVLKNRVTRTTLSVSLNTGRRLGLCNAYVSYQHVAVAENADVGRAAEPRVRRRVAMVEPRALHDRDVGAELRRIARHEVLDLR